jgi:putative aldouronate transport system permease protein
MGSALTTQKQDVVSVAALDAKKSKRRKNIEVNLMLLPAIALLFIFNYIPMYGVILAFKDFNLFDGIINSPWAGFENFKTFLTDPKFWQVLKNTVYINLCDILFGFTAPIIFALLLNEIRMIRFKKTVQIISYMPNFLSWVVVSGLVITMLSPDQNGLVNKALGWFGIEPIFFMSEPDYFVPIIVIAEIWKSIGFASIVYVAALTGIDDSLYEAATIDGAGRLRCAWHVTIPGILPMVMLMLIFRVASIFSIGFDRIFLLQNSLNREAGEVISTYVYSLGIEKAMYSRTTAIGLVQSVLGLILVYSANTLSRKVSGFGIY